MDKFKVSEIFYSPQGEGKFTGQLSVWVRFFSCNLQCAGFSQKDPTDPSTYVLPHLEYDLKKVTHINELPVFPYGCDTSYSWSSKYKHLCPSLTASEIADQLIDKLPHKNFFNPFAANDVHLVFTGGEPLLPKGQKMIIQVIDELFKRDTNWSDVAPNAPFNVTIETNGTQVLSEEFISMMKRLKGSVKFFISISPKLHNVSGEIHEKTFNVLAVEQFSRWSHIFESQLKFVVTNTNAAWDELEETIQKWREYKIYSPIWIMPLGATIEQQDSNSTVEVIEEAMRRGYNVSSRVHVFIWGNKIGT